MYIPGFDEQPLSVSVAGVSGDHTTYLVAQGSPTGTFPSGDGFPPSGVFLPSHIYGCSVNNFNDVDSSNHSRRRSN
jgi:hypothetical protein